MYTCDLCNKMFTTKQNFHRHSDRLKPCNLKKTNKCKWCDKLFSDSSNCSRHEKNFCPMAEKVHLLDIELKEKDNQIITTPNQYDKIINTSPITCEYVYLLQEREFINSGQSIYKIGRTKQLNDKRFKQYPKNSMLLLQTFCNNCTICETQIMNMFKQKYIHRVDIGSEYFEGNVKEMQRDIFNIVTKEF